MKGRISVAPKAQFRPINIDASSNPLQILCTCYEMSSLIGKLCFPSQKKLNFCSTCLQSQCTSTKKVVLLHFSCYNMRRELICLILWIPVRHWLKDSKVLSFLKSKIWKVKRLKGKSLKRTLPFLTGVHFLC